jgi:hypothetical protein
MNLGSDGPAGGTLPGTESNQSHNCDQKRRGPNPNRDAGSQVATRPPDFRRLCVSGQAKMRMRISIAIRRCNEAITTARNCLDETRALSADVPRPVTE